MKTTVFLKYSVCAWRKGNDAKDLNIEERISKFQSQLRDEYVYFTDLGKINIPLKIDFRIKCHVETDLKRLFESKKVLAAGVDIPSPDAKIILQRLLLSSTSSFY